MFLLMFVCPQFKFSPLENSWRKRVIHDAKMCYHFADSQFHRIHNATHSGDADWMKIKINDFQRKQKEKFNEIPVNA